MPKRFVSAPRGAEDGKDLAFLDGETDAVDHSGVVVPLDQIVDFDDGHGFLRGGSRILSVPDPRASHIARLASISPIAEERLNQPIG